MTQISEPPEGWEIQTPDEDKPLQPDEVRFVGPDGQILTLVEMVDQGLIAA